MENPNYMREAYVTDSSDYKEVIRLFEEKGEEKLFLFNVTIQNHGGYQLNTCQKFKFRVAGSATQHAHRQIAANCIILQRLIKGHIGHTGFKFAENTQIRIDGCLCGEWTNIIQKRSSISPLCMRPMKRCGN